MDSCRRIRTAHGGRCLPGLSEWIACDRALAVNGNYSFLLRTYCKSAAVVHRHRSSEHSDVDSKCRDLRSRQERAIGGLCLVLHTGSRTAYCTTLRVCPPAS